MDCIASINESNCEEADNRLDKIVTVGFMAKCTQDGKLRNTSPISLNSFKIMSDE